MKTRRLRALPIAMALAALLVAACGGDGGGDEPSGGGESALRRTGFPNSCPAPSDSFERMNEATYQVFGEAVLPGPDGQLQQIHMFIGTAWAVRDHLLVTNAHVTEAFVDSAEQGVQFSRAIAVQSGTGTVIRLLRGITHPDYNQNPLGSADVGLFTSEQALPQTLELAPADSVLALGDEIQIAGFPGDVENFLAVVPGQTVPQVTSLTGSISARRSHDDTEAVTPETLSVYQHQAPTSPGTSGGAMVHCGLVAAVNNAGTVRLVLTPGQNNQASIDRQPAASNNFAVHVRHIHELVRLFDENAVQGFELPVEATQQAQQAGGQPGAATLVGGYVAAVTATEAQHQFQFVVSETGQISGVSRWAATGDFMLSGQMAADGSFLIADDAPERLGYRRGVYEGRVGPNGAVEGRYFEQTQEQMTWPFTGQRAQ